MKSCALIANQNKDGAASLMAKAAGFLQERGIMCYTASQSAQTAQNGAAATSGIVTLPFEQLFSHADFVIILGGDGTILDNAPFVCRAGVPV